MWWTLSRLSRRTPTTWLVNKTSDTLESYIQQFFDQVLNLSNVDTKLKITGCVHDLIYGDALENLWGLTGL